MEPKCMAVTSRLPGPPAVPRRARRPRLAPQAVVAASPAISVADSGSYSVRGSSRKVNEDRLALQDDFDGGASGLESYAAVFDGHGGSSTAQWLEDRFAPFLKREWRGGAKNAEFSVSNAFRKADTKLLAPKGGFFGSFGERGVGGAKCGATAAVALLFSEGGGTKLLAANVGDARVLLVRGRKALQVTEDHVPDDEGERERIEATNPNPKMPLVRYVAGTWRVGGILALSRAFGDAYMKGSGQFEGVPAGSDGYSSGFGVVADPYVTVTDLTSEDSWVILATDGLFANTERGGGGGLSNQEAADLCRKLGQQQAPEQVAEGLASTAQAKGSTDDVTVVVLRLQAA